MIKFIFKSMPTPIWNDNITLGKIYISKEGSGWRDDNGELRDCPFTGMPQYGITLYQEHVYKMDFQYYLQQVEAIK